jgi:hypothetical protein
MVVSPFLTLEEGRAAQELAAALGMPLAFASPAPDGLQDAILHTGDPCPNRRGLSELGIEAATPEELAKLLAGAESALLVGERVAELVGRETLAALPAGLRLIVLDVRALDAAATDVCIAVPTWVERNGHWVNVDGHRRPVAMVRPPPPGVRDLRELLGALAGSGSREEVGA